MPSHANGSREQRQEHQSPRLYLDNAATSFPKPPAVHEAMLRYATEIGASPGRGTYAESLEGARLLRDCRERLSDLLGVSSPDHVIFTLNTSDALNLAIKGVVGHHRRTRRASGEIHMVATAMEHNSVLRPLNALAADGLAPKVTWTCVEADQETGLINPADVRAAIRPQTVLVAAVHASNVTGTLQPLAPLAEVAHAAGVPLLVDAAQSAGRVPIDMASLGIDLLAAPGHKSLLGPLGTGVLCMRPGLEDHLDTIREGGTGTVSELDTQPDTLPDKYEPGSHNTLGIVGLREGVRWLLHRGVDALWADETERMSQLLEALSDADRFPGLRLIGPPTIDHRVGVFTFVHEAASPSEIARALEHDHGILTRGGVHCAPRAHGTFGTRHAGGGLRISLGPFITKADIERTLDALAAVCRVPAGV